MTQPVMWDIKESEYEALLWMGGVGYFMNGESDTYYSPQVLAEAMDRYNEKLLAFAAKRK